MPLSVLELPSLFRLFMAALPFSACFAVTGAFAASALSWFMPAFRFSAVPFATCCAAEFAAFMLALFAMFFAAFACICKACCVHLLWSATVLPL